MDIHRPADAVIGFLLIGLPFVLDLGAAAMVVSVLLGSALIAIAYGGGREGDSIAASTHLAIDRLVAGGSGFAALLALVAAHVAGAVILLLLALSIVALTLTTRYRHEPGARATTVTWDNRRQGGARG